MTIRQDSDDYLSIFLNDAALMDLRAPIEFSKGAFPTASNIPLLDDAQRHEIGIRYKQAGEQEAIALGLKLATPDIRQQRLQRWMDFCHKNQQGFLYCFRGGLRSRTSQQWLRGEGVDYPLIKGGYKAMRRFLIDELETSVEALPLVIVSGLTGSGKTRVLKQISRHVDFEGIADHRGSAFGRNPGDRQPTTIDWENRVSIELLKLRHQSASAAVFVEDEGRRIGRIGIPDNLYRKMLAAPRAILEVDLQSRIQLIADDYIISAWPNYQIEYGDSAQTEFRKFVLDNLARIHKRLGGDKYKQVKACFELALNEFLNAGEVETFYEGIGILLQQYYDPMYCYQLANKDVDIIFKGTEEAYLQWCEDYLARLNYDSKAMN